MNSGDHCALDDCFALMGEDVDFIGDIVHSHVPVLTYRWSNAAIGQMAPSQLMRRGRDAMKQLGLMRIRWEGQHLRGDTPHGQRVKMTVLNWGGKSMYLLMTAGMPGTRNQAKAINCELAELLDRSTAGQTACHALSTD